MPLTLDLAPALIVIDLQKGVVSLPTAHPIEQVVQRAAALAAAFRSQRLPVVLVNVIGVPLGRTEQSRFKGDLPEEATVLVPELDHQPSDHLVSKRSAGAFTRTDLETYLREKQVSQVVIVGVATGMGVEATARQAHELGFNVAFAVDAMPDMDADLKPPFWPRSFHASASVAKTSRSSIFSKPDVSNGIGGLEALPREASIAR